MAVRVLFLAERFPPEVAGGGELSASLVARAVADQPGLEVSVLTQGGGSVDEVDGVRVERKIPRAHGSIPDDVARGELLTARSAPFVARALRGADLVHCVSPRAIPAAVAGARLARRPATAVMNDTWATCFVHTHVRRGKYCPRCSPSGLRECLEDHGGNASAAAVLWRQFRRRLPNVKRLSGIVPVCPTIERLLRDHGVESAMTVIPLPMDFRPWEGASEREAEPGLVVLSGRLSTGKGVLEAIEAFAVAAATRPRARLEVVGDGTLLEAAKGRVRELDLVDSVSFIGWKPPEELPGIIGRAQVVLAPFTRVEAFGRVLLEAAAAGRTVVTTDLGGGTEVLHRKPGAGCVVPWDDPASWGEALGELLDDPAGCARMGQEARRRVEALYSPGGVGPAYRDFFEQVLKDRS